MGPGEEARQLGEKLRALPDPLALLGGIFANAPVGFQIYRADGVSLLTNAAFRRMFGSEPPPEYNVLHDELAERGGVLTIIHRAFAGETVTIPTFWYDPRELQQVKVTEGRRVAMTSTFFPIFDARGAVAYVAIVFEDRTVEQLSRERAAGLLRVASALSEAPSFAQVAQTIVAEAQEVTNASSAALLALDDARSSLGEMPASPRFERGRAVLPLVSSGRTLSVLTLDLPDAEDLLPEEREWLLTLARLCAEAYERALIDEARTREAEAAAESARFLAAAGAALGESLDLGTTLRRVTDLCLQRLGDYAFVDILGAEPLRVVSAKTAELKSDIERWSVRPPPPEPLPSQQAQRRRQPVILGRLGDDELRRFAVSDEHFAYMKALDLRGHASFPLVARGELIGALSFGRVKRGGPFSADELALAEDLSRRAALAVESARLYGEAQRAVRLREDFLSIAGHELRTPLTALSLQVQTIRRKLDKAGLPAGLESLAHSAEVAERQVRRLALLVQQLLDVSRLQAGRLEIEAVPLELCALAREVAGRFEAELQKGATLTVRCDQPLEGVWDRLRLEQILTNLLSNALRYGAGQPVEVHIERKGDRAVVRVRDQGIGIAPGDQARIFQRFERAAPVRNYGGVGLGLWIVRELLEAMGGSISVESTPGAGSTFTFELPLARP